MISCPICKKQLSMDDPSKEEFKTCPECVVNTTPMSRRKIIRPNTPGKPTEEQEKAIEQEVDREFGRDKDGKIQHDAAHMIEYNYLKLPTDTEGKMIPLVEVVIRNYYKKKLLSFGLSKEQLQIWIDDLTKIEKNG